MTTDTAARVAADYLGRLDRAGQAAGLPREQREALRAELRERLDEAVALAVGSATDAVLDEMDRLGEPGAVVERAARDLDVGPAVSSAQAAKPGALEVLALVGICVGWMFFGFGAAVALVALVMSRCWTVTDKLLGMAAAVCPLAVTIAGISSAGSGVRVNPAEQGLHVEQILGPALFVMGIVAPFFAAAYLWRRAKRAS